MGARDERAELPVAASSRHPGTCRLEGDPAVIPNTNRHSFGSMRALTVPANEHYDGCINAPHRCRSARACHRPSRASRAMMLEHRAAFDGHPASRRRMFLTALIALFALGCSDAMTSTRNARPTKANMSVAASISSRSATQVLLVAFYLTTPLDTTGLTGEIGSPGGAGPLGTQLVDLQSTSSQSVSSPSTSRRVSPIPRYLIGATSVRTSTSKPFCSPGRTS